MTVSQHNEEPSVTNKFTKPLNCSEMLVRNVYFCALVCTYVEEYPLTLPCYVSSSFSVDFSAVSDGASYWASGALPHHSLAIDFNITHSYCTFSFTTFSKS